MASNHKLYPENVSEPITIDIPSGTITVYGYRFRGINDFYEFLTKNPLINYKIWPKKEDLSSLSSNVGFAGKPYNEAVQDLIKDQDPGYKEYLKVQENMHNKLTRKKEYVQIKTVAGGFTDPVAYTVGSPTIYRTSRAISKPKFATIATQIAYNWGTSKYQVFNRALIITNLVRALERQGYNINLKSFMLAQVHNEVIKAIFDLKKYSQPVDYQSLYKSLVNVEFFRRLCFRLIEISPVKNHGWASSYGYSCSEDLTRKLLDLSSNDIYFPEPDGLNIYGRNIGDDFENAIRCLNLTDVIDVPFEKKILMKSVKVLKKEY